MPEHASLDAAIAALDLSPPPALTPPANAVRAAAPILPFAGAPPAPVGTPVAPLRIGRDIAREERIARRNTHILVASLWTVALALAGGLLFMIQR